MNRRHKIIVILGGLLALAAAAGVTQQASSSKPEDLPAREVREQAARVVMAYELNGPYMECMQERGWDLRWEWGIHVAPSLEGNAKLEAVADDFEAKLRGDGRDDYYAGPKFETDYNACRDPNPAASDEELDELVNATGLDHAEQVAHWDNVMRRATQLGWAPSKPFADLTPQGLVVD